MLKEICIEGFRGFSKAKRIGLAVPDGSKGSGLNIFVGCNNTGKTTITEAIRNFNVDTAQISFSVGKRNLATGGKIKIDYVTDNDESYSIYTKETGGSQVDTDRPAVLENIKTPFLLPSRRHVEYELQGFHVGISRQDYMNNENSDNKFRKPVILNFQQRIFSWEESREAFDEVLYKIIDRNLTWYIDQNDNGNYYLAFRYKNAGIHTSEGIGDGIWSVFTIVDTFYDAEKGDIIVIDEPELSLHPQYQKKILKLLLEESADKQMVVCTHSPYFISWDALQNGAMISRTFKKENGEIDVRSLSKVNVETIYRSLRNYKNPHSWGMDAKELFFLEDNVIVVEGQEDVVAFNKMMEELDIEINASFFGWGAGGAGNIGKILKILRELGYKKVTAIYDGDRNDDYENCREDYPEYNVIKIWKDDIRDKLEHSEKVKEGILDEGLNIKEGTEPEIRKFLEGIKEFFEY